MHPILFRADGIVIYSYGLMVALGILAGFYVIWRLGQSMGFEKNILTDMAFYTVLTAILGARVGFVLLNAPYYMQHPVQIIKIWDGGLVFSFGFVFGFATLFLVSRQKKLQFLKVADLWAPALAIGQAIGRVGCFLAGCCYGRETDSWCSVRFDDPNSLAPLHVNLYPTQLFHSFANLCIFFILVFISKKKRYNGQVMVWYMILHPVQRLLIERYRGDFRGTLNLLGTQMTVTQALSLLMLISGVILLFVLKKRQDKDLGG